MKIGMDARFLRSEGVERYIGELIRYLPELDPGSRYLVYFADEAGKRRWMVERSNLQPLILPASPFSFWEQPLLAFHLRKDRPDIFHATNYWTAPLFAPCPVVITVHDVFHKTLPAAVSLKARIYGRLVLPLVLSSAKRIIAVSQFTRDELAKVNPDVLGKVSVIYHGVDPHFRPIQDGGVVTARYGIKGDYLLYVGSLRPYKNVSRLIQAYAGLPQCLRQQYQLVVAARKAAGYSNLLRLARRLGVEEKVHFIGFVPREDLPSLYGGCTVCVFPSTCEYFGFPLLEAMACGAPTIASHLPALVEVGGDAAFYIDPLQTRELREALEQVVSDESLRGVLKEKGLARVGIFSWLETTRRIIQVYYEAGYENGR